MDSMHGAVEILKIFGARDSGAPAGVRVETFRLKKNKQISEF